jgi:hypothetical protein
MIIHPSVYVESRFKLFTLNINVVNKHILRVM